MIGVGILIVHLFAQTHPPLGYLEGKGDIGSDHCHDHDQIPDVKNDRENHADQQQFQRQWTNRKQEKPQQKLHPLDPALNNPAETTGLAGDVVTH